MTSDIQSTGPQNPFLQGSDIRLGTDKDTAEGFRTGLRFAEGDSPLDKLKGFLCSVGHVLKGLVQPLARLAEVLRRPGISDSNATRELRALGTPGERASLFPEFKSAEVLGQADRHTLRELARQAKICMVNSSTTGLVECHDTQDDDVTFPYKLDPGSGVLGGYPQSNPTALREELATLFDQFPSTIKENITTNHGSFIDEKTGLVATFILDTSQDKPVIHVVFGGTGAGGQTKEHIAHDLSLASPEHVPPSFKQASALVKVIKDAFGEESEIQTKGFSMGGGLAVYAGIDNDVTTVALCPAPMSPACQRELGDTKLHAAVRAGRITNLANDKCFLTGHPKLAKLGHAFERATGQVLPHFIGGGYRLGHTPDQTQARIDEKIRENGACKALGLIPMDHHNFSALSWAEFSTTSDREALAMRAEMMESILGTGGDPTSKTDLSEKELRFFTEMSKKQGSTSVPGEPHLSHFLPPIRSVSSEQGSVQMGSIKTTVSDPDQDLIPLAMNGRGDFLTRDLFIGRTIDQLKVLGEQLGELKKAADQSPYALRGAKVILQFTEDGSPEVFVAGFENATRIDDVKGPLNPSAPLSQTAYLADKDDFLSGLDHLIGACRQAYAQGVHHDAETVSSEPISVGAFLNSPDLSAKFIALKDRSDVPESVRKVIDDFTIQLQEFDADFTNMASSPEVDGTAWADFKQTARYMLVVELDNIRKQEGLPEDARAIIEARHTALGLKLALCADYRKNVDLNMLSMYAKGLQTRFSAQATFENICKAFTLTPEHSRAGLEQAEQMARLGPLKRGVDTPLDMTLRFLSSRHIDFDELLNSPS